MSGPDRPVAATDPGSSGARPARLAVGVVSAGRVGAVLGRALGDAGHLVVGVAAVSRASRARAEALLPEAPVLPPDEVVTRSDLVILAVPDDVLPGLVSGLAAAGCFRPGQIVAHTCGSRGVRVLDPAAGHGVLPLALHPVMTFTGRPEDVQRLAACSVGVTAAEIPSPATGATDTASPDTGLAGVGPVGPDPVVIEAGWSVGEALVVEMGAEPFRVPEAARPLYHAALAHGANHLITLVRDCVQVLERAGIGPAERLVAPLLSAALDNALRHGDRALTGPVARGDVGTLRGHLRELTEHAPEVAESYRVLARRTAARARDAGLLRDTDETAVDTALEDTP